VGLAHHHPPGGVGRARPDLLPDTDTPGFDPGPGTPHMEESQL
jgi:dihydroorotate dehydrogenase (NAD+) catalytic subunit